MTNLPHTKNLELDISNGWLTIWLNRPNSRNALTNDMIEDELAALALIRLINENVGEIDLIGIGPLTNIAVALNIDPTIAEKLKSFTVMGGNIYSFGNADRYLAEYNFYTDPDAAFVAIERLVPKVYFT